MGCNFSKSLAEPCRPVPPASSLPPGLHPGFFTSRASMPAFSHRLESACCFWAAAFKKGMTRFVNQIDNVYYVNFG